MKPSIFSASVIALFLALFSSTAQALIQIGSLSKEEAKEKGIVMKSRPNGDAGIKVWLEFTGDGFLKDFTYVDLRVRDAEGEHLLSARLQPHPVVHGQVDEVVTVSFSAQPEQLKSCSFLVVAYGSKLGDIGYDLAVADFLDLPELE